MQSNAAEVEYVDLFEDEGPSGVHRVTAPAFPGGIHNAETPQAPPPSPSEMVRRTLEATGFFHKTPTVKVEVDGPVYLRWRDRSREEG